MIFKVLAKMKIFQIWAKIDDFFKFLAKMMIFQNLVKIDGFSNFNFLCHLKFSNSSQCGMLWCGVVQTTLLWCGVELIPHHTFRQSTLDPGKCDYPNVVQPPQSQELTKVDDHGIIRVLFFGKKRASQKKNVPARSYSPLNPYRDNGKVHDQ